MIIMKLWGGLGNQLFEYALGRRLAHDRKTRLFLDLSFFKKDSRRRYSLSDFNIEAAIAPKSQIFKLKFLNFFNSNKSISEKSLVQERGFAFDQEILTVKDSVYLNGYWQSHKYFEDIDNILRKEITLKKTQDEKYIQWLEKISTSNSVAIHVRRSDYLSPKNLKVFTVCSSDYYRQAVKIITDRITEPKLFVFFDKGDGEWAKQNIIFPFQTEFISGTGLSDCQELMLMSACKHNITSNSTFSWWASWLNQNPEKIVITPRKWVVDPAREARDIIPSGWIRL